MGRKKGIRDMVCKEEPDGDTDWWGEREGGERAEERRHDLSSRMNTERSKKGCMGGQREQAKCAARQAGGPGPARLFGVCLAAQPLVCFSVSLAKQLDVQVVLGGAVALTAARQVTEVTAAMGAPAKGSKLENAEVGPRGGEGPETICGEHGAVRAADTAICLVEMVISGFLPRMRSFPGFPPRNQHALPQTAQPC